MKQEVLSAKLLELEQAVRQLETRTRELQSGDVERLREEIETLIRCCDEGDERFRACALTSRNPVMRELAGREMHFCERIREITANQDEEMCILQAEFAIDAAIQAARRAQLAALIAIDRVNTNEEGEIV